jgi:lipopolysaccharide export system protein LptA
MSRKRNPDRQFCGRLPRFAVGALAVVLSIAPAAHAEKGDREKPIQVDADRQFGDQKKQESTFEGHVIINQGTLRIDADRVVVRQDNAGNTSVSATGDPAKFRQKRDGFDEFVEGYAQRIEYDGKTDIARFFDKAKVKRNQDEINSNYIQYNANTEIFEAFDPRQKQAGVELPGSRVRAVIQPKQKSAPATGSQPPVNSPLPLKPTESVSPPRQ